MEDLDRFLAIATSKIRDIYFQLPIDGGPAVFRERVYCYELYHQLRVLWKADCPYTVSGEVAKGGHPILSQLGATQIPDLLVHRPGDMTGNHAIIEVKPCTAKLRGVNKDIKTLQLFYSRVGYRRAIYLLYGEFSEKMLRKIEKKIEDIPFIELWIHRTPGTAAYQSKLRYQKG